MLRIRFALVTLGLLLAVSGAHAQGGAGVKATVPFDFIVGNRVLPAGEYVFTPEGQVNHVIAIRSNDTNVRLMAITQSCALAEPSGSTKLVFHTMAGQYFLSQIWAQGYSQGRQLPMSKTEVRLSKNGSVAGEFVLAANLTN